jgi:sporulation protein YlmC with PRC-barrel domain
MNMQTTTTPRTLSSGTFTGTSAVNRQNEKIGKIKELMLDLNSRRVAYAVLSFGGIFGIGDKLFAIPWEMIEVNTTNHQVVIDISKDKLKNAPGFDKNNWPDTANPAWLTEVYDYYGYPPYWIR